MFAHFDLTYDYPNITENRFFVLVKCTLAGTTAAFESGRKVVQPTGVCMEDHNSCNKVNNFDLELLPLLRFIVTLLQP